jgi:hypothetical protein
VPKKAIGKKGMKAVAALDTTDLPALRELLKNEITNAKKVAQVIQALIAGLGDLIDNTTELETVNQGLSATDISIADAPTLLEKKELKDSKLPLEARKTKAESVLTHETLAQVLAACADATTGLGVIKRGLGAIK